jgi:hypothetical protein
MRIVQMHYMILLDLMCAKCQARSGGLRKISPVVDGPEVITALLLFPSGQLEINLSIFLDIKRLCHVLELLAGITVVLKRLNTSVSDGVWLPRLWSLTSATGGVQDLSAGLVASLCRSDIDRTRAHGHRMET